MSYREPCSLFLNPHVIVSYSPDLAANIDTVDDLIQSALVSPGALTLGSVD